jgi:hypothetical protein
MDQPTTFLDLPILALARALTPIQALNLIKVRYRLRTRGSTYACCPAKPRPHVHLHVLSPRCGPCTALLLCSAGLFPQCGRADHLQTCRFLRTSVDSEVFWHILAARLWPAPTLRCPPYPDLKARMRAHGACMDCDWPANAPGRSVGMGPSLPRVLRETRGTLKPA